MPDLFTAAVNAHKANNLAAAEHGYRTVIVTQPKHAEAHYLLGAVLLQSKRLEGASASLKACLKISPKHAAARSMLGPVLSQLGEHDQAIKLLKETAKTDPRNPKAHFNLGKACLDAGQFEDAAEALKNLLKLVPNHPEAMNGYATCLAETGKTDEALAYLRDAMARGIITADLQDNYLRRLLDSKAYEEALIESRAAQTRWPEVHRLRLVEAIALHQLDRRDEARVIYEDLVRIDPDDHDYNNKLASLLYEIGRWKEAEGYARQAIALQPKSVGALNNLGRIRQIRGDLDGARQIYQKALDLLPDNGDAHNNMGNICLYADQMEESLAAFDRAMALKPHSNGIRFNRSIVLLTQGRFQEAWREHRLRFDKEESIPGRTWDCPVWDGEPIDGKRVLLWSDQGIGDQIIHIRAASAVAAAAADCAVECSKRLTSLFSRSFPNIEIIGVREPADPRLAERTWDVHSSVQDIHVGRIASPADINPAPYLQADPELTADLRRKYRNEAGDRPLIGISWWSGGSIQSHFKTTPLADWLPILRTPDAAFVNLQYGDHSAELDGVTQHDDVSIIQDRDVDPMGEMDAFAAQVAAMDMVLTISNTTAHMAGALGVPVWNMTPTGPGRLWYWFLEGEQSPWYQSMRLFRHTYREPWDGVIASVQEALSAELPNLAASASQRGG
jgi:tetratricopeptide (TPR) repeat protein